MGCCERSPIHRAKQVMDITTKAQYSNTYKQKAWDKMKLACPEGAEGIKQITRRFGKMKEIRFITDDHNG